MNEKMLGFLNLHHSPNLGALTSDRSLASTSFLGRYAFMDFTLSNFTNSNIDQVGILVASHPRSILKHLGSRNTWSVNTKTGFEVIMYNEKGHTSKRYNHDFANIVENDWVLRRSDAEYIVFAPAHFLVSIDFRDVLKEHIANRAEITLVYTHVHNAKKHFIGCDIVSLSDDQRVVGLSGNKGAHNDENISLETYIVNRKKLLEIIEKSEKLSSFFGLHDYVSFTCNAGERINAYQYEGFVRCFDSFEHYVEYSLEMLDYSIRSQLFKETWPIYTVTHDTPPARYGERADVSSSFIANGTRIEGTVKNSIVSRDVIVEAGAVVTNSILLTNSYIGTNRIVNHVVVDKAVKVLHVEKVEGSKIAPLYIHKGDTV